MKASSAAPVFFLVVLLFSNYGEAAVTVVSSRCKRHEPMPNCEVEACQSFCAARPEGAGTCSDTNTCRCEFSC